MAYLIVLLFTFTTQASEILDAKASVRALIAPLIVGQGQSSASRGTEKFRIDGCEQNKINWPNVIMMKSTAVLHFKFKHGCDIQGAISPKILQWFPANLDLRNIKSYQKISTSNKITADLQAQPILKLEMRQGVLTGKDSTVRFEADYRVQMNLNEKNPITENLGGEMRILEINGKQVSIKEKLLVK